MIINMNMEKFCPDNCPHCDVEVLDISTFRDVERMFVCRNAALCKFVYELAKAEDYNQYTGRACPYCGEPIRKRQNDES